MLDPKVFVQETEKVKSSLLKRNKFSLLSTLEKVLELDKVRKQAIQKVEELKAKQNQASVEIAKLKREKQDAAHLLEAMKEVSETIKKQDAELLKVEEELKQLYYEFPNVLHDSVPVGKESTDNIEVKRWGQPKVFSWTPKSHDEIGEGLGILDFKKAGEVTGSRFVFVKGRAAKLERALIQFMLAEHELRGYQEIIPPFLVNRASLTGTGQLPKFEEDVFRIDKFDFFLIPTAEVPVTNYHREEIVEEARLPLKYCAYTPCFRSEAGSYGKDTKGLKRQHQFNKVELVQLVKPETSFVALENLLADAENILQKLELPYRVVSLCGGDVGAASSKTYDIEVWVPSVQGYMEISSCSNFVDYQARRANIRYRDSSTKKVSFLHTLNGSGLAVGRTLLAIIENYQTADGNFEIPEVLKKYFS